MGTNDNRSYPTVDLFAGPGGLGEGFSSVVDESGTSRFENILSIERDEHAHSTLQLRHFFRSFKNGEVPDEYYMYLHGDIDKQELFLKFPENLQKAIDSSYKLTLGPENHRFVHHEIERKLGRTRKWALIGGPPCQAYSLVGRSRMKANPGFEDDVRHFLYLEYLKIIADHRPPVFVMENVKGMLSAKVRGEPIIKSIMSDLSSPETALGNKSKNLEYRLYSLTSQPDKDLRMDPKQFLVRAENYGVPQARHRMFILGIRSDLAGAVPQPLRRHSPPTVSDTIGKLPKIRSGLSKSVDSFERWEAEVIKLSKIISGGNLEGTVCSKKLQRNIKAVLESARFVEQRNSKLYVNQAPTNHAAIANLYDPRLTSLTGHEARSHMASDLRRYFFASIFAKEAGRSPKLADFPEALLPLHKNVEEGRSGKMFSDRFRVQLPDTVSTTITSHISKDGHYFIHYDPLQCRSLTVREAARLQTFPDNYKFEGPRTSQYHQVGNAVPPYLAKQIGEVIASLLDSFEEAE